MDTPVDFALVGGGLQGGLIALAIRHHQPDARIVMVERGAAPGGNHTWCFHAADVRGPATAWIDPLVVHRWPGYDVAFPAHQRRLDAPYACVTSDRLATHVTTALEVPGSRLMSNATATEVHADRVAVRVADGTFVHVHARAVIDARGPDRTAPTSCGWQKFLGQEWTLTAPHGLDRPMLMDATVPQRDGFRFLYVLPLAPDRVLIEDTYFSDRAFLDVAALRTEIAAYATARGWTVRDAVREEVGVLPLPWDHAPPSTAAPLVAGYAGGWFHPVTGYSFPIATRLANLIAQHPADRLHGAALDELAGAHGSQLRFALRLNHMLFHWFAPDQRFHVLERFYRLPEDVVARFYALELTRLDRARIVVGRPPRGMSLRGVLGMEAR